MAADREHQSVILSLKAKGAVCDSQLLLAVLMGETEAVRNLLNVGEADPNWVDQKGMSAVCWAALAGKSSVMEVLLENPKSDAEFKVTKYCLTPLILAAGYKHKEVVELLINKANVDVNYRYENLPTALDWAVDSGSNAIIESILGTGRANLRMTGRGGSTALMTTAMKGNEVGFRILWQSDKGLDCTDCVGRSVLFYAIKGGNRHIVDLILSEPSVNIFARDFYDATPLSMAARFGDNDTLRKILTRCDGTTAQLITTQDKLGRSPVMWAALKGHNSTRKFLLESCRTLGLMEERDVFAPLVIPSGLAPSETRKEQGISCDVCFVDIWRCEPYYTCGECLRGHFVCCRDCRTKLQPKFCMQPNHRDYLRDKFSGT